MDMREVVLCKHCGQPEYWGEFRWIQGEMFCRQCFMEKIDESKIAYWENDFEGDRPTWQEYEVQERRVW